MVLALILNIIFIIAISTLVPALHEMIMIKHPNVP